MGALLLAAAALLDRHPLRWGSPERELPGSLPPPTGRGAAVLLYDGDSLPREAAAVGAAPSEYSFAWLSVLEEEVGRTRTLELSGTPLSARALDGTLTIVATRSCGERAARWAATLDSCATAGALLVLEQPHAALAAWFGFQLESSERTAARVTRVAPVLPYARADWFEGIPVATSSRAGTSVPGAARPLLWLDGTEAAWVVPRGEGAAVLLACDLGRWLTGLYQGAPGKPERAASEPAEAWEPRADLLVRTLLEAGFTQLPFARLSPLPSGATGLVIATYDESAFGDAAVFLNEISWEHGATSTTFVVPQHVTKGGLRRMQNAGADLQLAWDRGISGRAVRQLGLAGWRPLQRELSLAEQLAALRELLPSGAGPIQASRAFGSFPQRSPMRSFRVLEAAGLQLDSSLGPETSRFGYVHETGRPFRPLDSNSLPLRLLELPYPYHDRGRYHPRLQQRLVEESAAGFRSVLAPAFRPDTMAREPAAHRMRGLLDLFELAARHRQPVISIARYLEFRADRLAGTVHRVAVADSAATVDDGAEAAATFRRFEIEVVGPRQSVEVPVRLATGSVLRQLRINGFPLPPPAAEPCGWVQLPLPVGRHVLDVVYGGVPRR